MSLNHALGFTGDIFWVRHLKLIQNQYKRNLVNKIIKPFFDLQRFIKLSQHNIKTCGLAQIVYSDIYKG